MSNGYWPQWDGSWKYRILAYFLNFLSKKIGFKRTNAEKHDESYEKGGTEYDRIAADCWLYERLLQDAQDADNVFFATLCASIYFKFVRWFWASSFNYINDKKWTKW